MPMAARRASVAPLVVAADPSSWRPQNLKFELRMWNQNLHRANLTLLQKQLAWLIGQDTLALGFYFQIYDRLEDLVCEVAGVEAILPLSKSGVLENLCGFTTSEERAASVRRAAGLEGLGIIAVSRMHLEGKLRWCVTALPDAAQWKCGMVGVERLQARRDALTGQLRRFAPHLAGFAPDATLADALAASSFEQAGRAKRVEHDEMPFGYRRAATDAPEVRHGAGRGAVGRARSEIQNADLPAKARCVPTFRTPSRARLSKLDRELDSKIGQKTGQNNPSWMDSFKREELKSKLHGDQREFCYGARIIIGDVAWSVPANGFAANAIKWTLRWKAGGEHQRKAVAVFAEMLSADFVVNTTPVQAAEELWKQFGGLALDSTRFKKSKESF